MFRNFSFEASSRHPSPYDLDAERAFMNVSPTSRPFSPPIGQTRPPTPPAVTMGDLAQQFSQQNIRVEVDPRYQGISYNEPLTPPSDVAFEIDSSQLSDSASYTGVTPSSIRSQRQANMRWQCNPSNVKGLTLLVEKMVDNGEQCLVCTRRPEPPQPRSNNSSDVEEDEGVDMRRSNTPEMPSFNLKYRRSGERLNNGACVSKTVRMRKKKHRRDASRRQ